MLTAGCDVGALTTKAAIIRDNVLLGTEVVRSRAKAIQSAFDVMDRLLARLALSYKQIDYCVSTGYGRSLIPFAHNNISEISCHGRGANWLVPSVRTIIDGGGQDCKALRVDKHGTLVDFRMNVECAAGTGRALELMAESLGVDVSRLGPLSREARDPVVLNKLCCILTQIDIKRLVLEGRNPADIAAGINESAARYILQLVRGLGPRNDIAMTGGMAKNTGVFKYLERELETEFVKFPVEPDVIGAVGAAVLAADEFKKNSGV